MSEWIVQRKGGQRGKRVPVLIPPDASDAMKYISDPAVRTLGGVRPDNPYIFANSGHGVFSAWKCLKDLTEEHTAELIHPDRLSSTGYRAYMATVSQLIGLKDHQIQWLCNHLGYTEEIHKTHYRYTLGGIERIQLGKLLLLQDKNLVSKFQDKGLEDIQFEDIVSNIDGEKRSPEGSIDDEALEDIHRDDASDTVDVDEVACDITAVGPKDNKKPVARVRWTDKDMLEIEQYAEKWLKNRKTPSRKVCKTFIMMSKKAGGELHRRSAALIVKKK